MELRPVMGYREGLCKCPHVWGAGCGQVCAWKALSSWLCRSRATSQDGVRGLHSLTSQLGVCRFAHFFPSQFSPRRRHQAEEEAQLQAELSRRAEALRKAEKEAARKAGGEAVDW